MNLFARRDHSGRRSRHFQGWASRCFVVFAFFCLSGGVFGQSITFQDIFANRQTTTNSSGSLTGNNSTATVELGEPRFNGLPGGHSLWISWVAPADGVATFHTDGSDFDTLLTAWFFGNTNDTTVDKLQLAAGNDDSLGIAPASLIQVGVLAGHHYQISVDGYNGAVGNILLRWSFVNATSPPPIIVSVPNDQAARQGDTVSLTVDMTTSPGLNLQWRHDETEIEGFGTNYVITNLQPADVGRYSLRVKIGSVTFFTMPTEIQINSDGQTNALARDKLLESLDSPLIGDDGSGPSPLKMRFAASGGTTTPLIGVVRGYDGSQIFDTTYATTDPTEPPHCGVTGGSSYWLAYQPPANGTMTLDTVGSTYDTVMEAYTYNGTLTGYQDLISLGCNNDFQGAHGPSRIQVPVITSRQYLIVVDGVNGGRGIAYLNYSLNTNANAIPTAPVLLSSTAPVVVQPGASATLAPSISGCIPMQFSWKKNRVVIPGANLPALSFPKVAMTDTADYVVTAVNDLGTLNVTLPLHVDVPPLCSILRSAGRIQLSWPTATGQVYTIESASSLNGPWVLWTNSFIGNGAVTNIDVSGSGPGFYRLHCD